MLVLTRKTREQIRIGDDITVTILRTKGRSVQVGIEAPDSVRIIRSELQPHASVDVDRNNEEITTAARLVAVAGSSPIID